MKERFEKKENSEIQISSAIEADVRGVQEVFYKTWLATYPNKGFGITAEDIEERFKDSFTPEVLSKRWERIKDAQNEKLFVAKDGEKVVGLLRAIFHPDKNQLQAIYILPEYQNRGIGRKLWVEALKVFDSAKDTIVEVATYNQNAIDFYEKLGFQDSGRRFTEEKLRMKSGATIPEMEMVIKANSGSMNK